MLELLKAVFSNLETRSTQIETLESEGASLRGISIINELNSAYEKIGLISKLVDEIAHIAIELYSTQKEPVKILELGMRDGYLLEKLKEKLDGLMIPVELHGSEFQKTLTDLSVKRFEVLQAPVAAYFEPSCSLETFKDNQFDLVYSVFVIHHQTTSDTVDLLQNSQRISKYKSFHFDLERSRTGLLLVYLFYTFCRFVESREDALLSSMRALTVRELEELCRDVSLSAKIEIKHRFPFYWSLTVTRGVHR